MINYYKILDLENYAEFNLIKSAYKKKIRLYPPDINFGKEAEEITKYLNQAKEALSTEEKKQQYDKQLKLAYLVEIDKLRRQPKERYWQSLSLFEIRKKVAEAKEIKAKIAYNHSLNKFPFWMRILGTSILSIWGLQIFYSNYFVMYPGYETVLMTFGIMMFVGGIINLTLAFYKHYSFKDLDKRVDFNYPGVSRALIFLSLPLGIALIIGLNEYRKSYHLNNNFEYYKATIDEKKSRGEELVFSYTIGERTYQKSKKVKDWYLYFRDGEITIKYALIDPRITEIVYPKS